MVGVDLMIEVVEDGSLLEGRRSIDDEALVEALLDAGSRLLGERNHSLEIGCSHIRKWGVTPRNYLEVVDVDLASL